MTVDSAERPYPSSEAEQFRRELPGTIGCVTTFAFIAIIACNVFFPFPYGLIVAIVLVLFYVGSIAMFGQGSIIEMGLLAIILLTLSCLLGRISVVSHRMPSRSPDSGENSR
jgi:hypothetical protein